jgi:hypothetical protein
VTAAIAATIWAALALFVVAEALAGRATADRPASRAFSVAAGAGIVLLIAHMALALAARHGWSHDAAVRHTAAQTAAVYGLEWGGGFYLNYVFAALWAWDAWRRRRGVALPAGSRSALRAFYLAFIVNAAVVFVPAPRRWLGVVVVAALVWLWRPARLH